MLARVDHHFDRQGRKLEQQPVYHRERRIVAVAHAENDLELGIVLPAEGAQVFVQPGLRPAQRFQDSNGRQAHAGLHALT